LVPGALEKHKESSMVMAPPLFESSVAILAANSVSLALRCELESVDVVATSQVVDRREEVAVVLPDQMH
jgi:hypothetical protein